MLFPLRNTKIKETKTETKNVSKYLFGVEEDSKKHPLEPYDKPFRGLKQTKNFIIHTQILISLSTFKWIIFGSYFEFQLGAEKFKYNF